MPQEYRHLPWIYGTKSGKRVTLCGVLSLKVPLGFAVLQKNGTQQLNRLTQNPPSEECGTIAAADMSWFAMLLYDPIGYIKEDRLTDTDCLMQCLKQNIDDANGERRQKGWEPLEMVGWEQLPAYDPVLKQLSWSTKLSANGFSILNYETRLLGREGVTEIILVTDYDKRHKSIGEFKVLLGELHYLSGKRHKDYRPDDKTVPPDQAFFALGKYCL